MDFKNKQIIIFLSRPDIRAFLALLGLGAVISFLSPHFLTSYNLMNILLQASILTIITIGETLIIFTGSFDLSPGSVVGLVNVIVAGLLVNSKVEILPTITIVILLGTGIGFFNGIVINVGRVPSLLATLAMLAIARGAALIYTGGSTISMLPQNFVFLGKGSILGIPILVLILLAISIIVHIMMSKTRMGRHIYAIGGNEQAAIVSGISTRKIKVFVFALAGCLYAIGGTLLAARLDSGYPWSGNGYELDAIAATVLGGNRLMGGSGTIYQSVIGALILIMLNNALDLMDVNPFFQFVAKGIVIIIATLGSIKGIVK